ncbi:MAG: HAD family hydrolase [Gemmatimonadales bacterium]|nr:MAG: HAD family hydrolase [Gemmatimonadales bacterium]
MRRLVLFDIDGTILLTAGAGRRALTAALAAEMASHEAFERVRFDGKTDPQIVAELLQAASHPAASDVEYIRVVCHRYVALLEAELLAGRTRTTVRPGIGDLLDALEREAGVVLGLLTGNIARGAELKLAAAGLDPARFRIGAFGSDSAHRPDLPAIATQRAEGLFGRQPGGAEVVIIGDTPADMTCGQGIGARAIGVATGSYAISDLSAAGAHAVFGDLSDTLRVLEAILAE